MLFQLKNGEAYKMGELKDFGQVAPARWTTTRC
jgi:hypothetical protein